MTATIMFHVFPLLGSIIAKLGDNDMGELMFLLLAYDMSTSAWKRMSGMTCRYNSQGRRAQTLDAAGTTA